MHITLFAAWICACRHHSSAADAVVRCILYGELCSTAAISLAWETCILIMAYLHAGRLDAVHLKLLWEQQPFICAAPAQHCWLACTPAVQQMLLPSVLPEKKQLAVQDGRLEAVHLELLGEQQRLEARLCSASAMCMHCHSGGLLKPILCQNGECSVSLVSPL